MTIKPSGLWCDLCIKPILDMPYWNITLGIGEDQVWGHSCKKCKEAEGETVTNEVGVKEYEDQNEN